MKAHGHLIRNTWQHSYILSPIKLYYIIFCLLFSLNFIFLYQCAFPLAVCHLFNLTYVQIKPNQQCTICIVNVGVFFFFEKWIFRGRKSQVNSINTFASNSFLIIRYIGHWADGVQIFIFHCFCLLSIPIYFHSIRNTIIIIGWNIYLAKCCEIVSVTPSS